MMDVHVLGKFVCVLLCAVGVVVAEDECASFGKVFVFYEKCFSDSIDGNPLIKDNSNFGKMCGAKAAIRKCMVDKTANCAEHVAIMAEVDNSFYVCDGTDVLSWVQQDMILPEVEELCLGNMTAMETCTDNAQKAGKGFPFTKETFSDGLEVMKIIKRAYFACFKQAYEANGSCTKSTRERTYKYSVLNFTGRLTEFFGMHLDETDEVGTVQNVPSLQQTQVHVRDVLRGILT